MSSSSIRITELLQETEQRFSDAHIPSPRLDAEVLLAFVLDVTRSYLHAHGDKELEGEKVGKLESLVKRRLRREPVAYLTGKKEFYGREFAVTPDVLIPRPETETLVELVLELEGEKVGKLESKEADSQQPTENSIYGLRSCLLDIGCGSGCIGMTLKLERPELDVTLCDISPKALTVAQKNAKNLGADVQCIESDLLSHFLTNKLSNFDVIVANLPYVDTDWQRSPETDYEPALALFAGDKGVSLIAKLLEQAPQILRSDGWLLLEADPAQHREIIHRATAHGFTLHATEGYALAFRR